MFPFSIVELLSLFAFLSCLLGEHSPSHSFYPISVSLVSREELTKRGKGHMYNYLRKKNQQVSISEAKTTYKMLNMNDQQIFRCRPRDSRSTN